MKFFYQYDFSKFIKLAEEFVNSTEKVNDKEDWGYREDQMTCRAGKSTFWVSWDGKMTACGIMDFPSVQYPFENDFKTCWMKLNEDVRNATVLSECKGCPKKEICHPCAAIIHTETGDVNKKASYLCEMADASLECWKKMLSKGCGKDAIEEKK